MFDSLWGADFTVAPQTSTKKLIDKVSKPKKVTTTTEKTVRSSNVTTAEKLAFIKDEVYRILGRYKENTVVIRTKEALHEYIDKAILNGEIAIDTETNNSLDPITCKLMGPCLYTPGMKNAYIPINHVNLYTEELLPDQLTEDDVRAELERLDDTFVIMHNGKFDYQVIKCTTGYECAVDWDTLIGSRCLDENERANLKQQYISKIDPSIEKYSIEQLFEGVEYAKVDPEVFALYAATDAFMTYQLYKWQKAQFETPGNEKLYGLFKDVEMPIVKIAAAMELTGIEIDADYAARLSEKYHKQVEAVDAKIEAELSKYDKQIEEWRATPEANAREKKVNKKGEEVWSKSKSEQLQTPIVITSPTQLAIFFYDVLKTPVVDKKKPRGTGEDILEAIGLPICNLILEKRGLEKLIGTYIDKLPKCVIPKTGRLHAHFNQIGADTGRFSSSDPNLQNIPSHQKDIRMMFKAADGHVLVGSDFSQQEPRLMCSYAHDEDMLNAYRNKQDLYASVATKVYHNGYWDNMEHYEDGTPNPAGKKRRSNCKSIILGILYGRGAASIASQIGTSVPEAQKIIDDFFAGYPNVKKWIDESHDSAKRLGYVEDFRGRRRRLPDIQKPLWEVRYKDGSGADVPSDFNPLIGSTGRFVTSTKSDIEIFTERLLQTKNKREADVIRKEAEAKGLVVHDNGGFIAQAERQCVNARVQGGAATLTKLAMIDVAKDEVLRDLGFKLQICVHDELIGECPEENAEKVAERLCKVMIDSAAKDVPCPMKCDPTIERCWYYSDYSDTAKEEYNELINSGKTSEEAFSIVHSSRPETLENDLRIMLDLC